MNKQKTLIFSLSVILFLALSFIVYSWKEPTTAMPSGYTAPLNTSSNFQEKYGPLIFPMMYDGDTCDDPLTENCPYYINPSGNSVLDGDITTSGNIITAYPTEVGHVATKGYVDDLLNNAGGGPASYEIVEGTACPEGTILISSYYEEKTCTYNSRTCSTPNNSCAIQDQQHQISTGPSGWGTDPSKSTSYVTSISYCQREGASCNWGSQTFGTFTCQAPITHVLCLTVDAPQ